MRQSSPSLSPWEQEGRTWRNVSRGACVPKSTPWTLECQSVLRPDCQPQVLRNPSFFRPSCPYDRLVNVINTDIAKLIVHLPFLYSVFTDSLLLLFWRVVFCTVYCLVAVVFVCLFVLNVFVGGWVGRVFFFFLRPPPPPPRRPRPLSPPQGLSSSYVLPLIIPFFLFRPGVTLCDTLCVHDQELILLSFCPPPTTPPPTTTTTPF